MSYAALMVHLEARRDLRKRVRLAVDLADRFDAALIGVAGWAYLPGFLADRPAADAKAGDSERREMTAVLARLEKEFRASAAALANVEWRAVLEFSDNLVPRQARAADLVIIGRAQDEPGDRYFALDPSIAILSAGRPVLLVPDNVDSLGALRVVVAWKDTRESRRAVRDAIPFLRNAEEVMIVEVCEHGTEMQSQRQIDDVANYLLSHKVTVGAKAYLHTEQTVAGELLRFAKDARADLIVAGGYGHSRLGEWAFGGVTRDLIADSPVCCLFSH
jgi:nucleotide-binding universal stress UspA family protein